MLFVSQGNSLKIEGSDQTDGSNKWTITAELVKPGQVTVDFSSKGGPKDLLGFQNLYFFFKYTFTDTGWLHLFYVVL